MSDYIVRVGGIPVAAVTSDTGDDAAAIMRHAIGIIERGIISDGTIRLLPESDPQPSDT